MEEFNIDLERCLEVLNAGGLILYPTDTVWGIGCDATNENAVANIYKLKKRQESKKMIVLMSSEKEVMQYVTLLDLSIFDYLETTSKPTTVIYEGVIGLADNIAGEDGNVAIRICKDSFCRHLLKRFQKPIVSTSANGSGNATPYLYSEISQEIIQGVDYVVSYRQKDDTPQEASSIVKCMNDGDIIILRD